MRRLPHKLLTVLLSLLLGLIPLQGVTGGFTPPLKQKGEENHYQMEAHHDVGVVLINDQAAELGCENCNPDTVCNGNNCSFGHCVSCLLALVPDFFFPTLQTTASIVIQTDSDLLSQAISSHFRPPRA